MMVGSSRRIAIMMMRPGRNYAFRWAMMRYLAARRSDAGSKPLQGQRGHQQPE
jgi:hypothetical protein